MFRKDYLLNIETFRKTDTAIPELFTTAVAFSISSLACRSSRSRGEDQRYCGFYYQVKSRVQVLAIVIVSDPNWNLK